MTAVQTVFLCVAGALVCSLFRVQKPEFRPVVGIAAALAALVMLLPGLKTAAEMIGELSAQAQMGEDSIALLMRATGIAMIAEAGAQICRDADEEALAGRVELAGRLALLGMSAPLLTDFGQNLMRMMSA